MLDADVLACSFESWYERFRSTTFRSIVIPLPEAFVQFLLADGIYLKPPEGAAVDAASDASDDEWGDGGSDSDGAEPASFPELEGMVVDAIASLGGAVMPKLNWSAPKDAKWLYSSLRCATAYEVFTLLKASDFVAHDLTHSFDHCSQREGVNNVRTRPDVFSLVLREWRDIDESGEFRCFVKDGEVCAISQRHASMLFPYLAETAFCDTLKEHIQEFFGDHVARKFTLERYAFDVYVSKAPRHKVKLVDFSPWGASTDPLLFDWEELEGDLSEVEFRVVRGDHERRAKLENYHAVPLEVAEFGATDPDELERLCQRAEANLRPQTGV